MPHRAWPHGEAPEAEGERGKAWARAFTVVSTGRNGQGRVVKLELRVGSFE